MAFNRGAADYTYYGGFTYTELLVSLDEEVDDLTLIKPEMAVIV